jgi:hypothetical protein
MPDLETALQDALAALDVCVVWLEGRGMDGAVQTIKTCQGRGRVALAQWALFHAALQQQTQET